jgi:hypothetical protein
MVLIYRENRKNLIRKSYQQVNSIRFINSDKTTVDKPKFTWTVYQQSFQQQKTAIEKTIDKLLITFNTATS